MRLIRRRRQRPVAGSACRSRCSRRLDTLFQPRRARPCSSSPRCPCGDARAVREIGGGCPTTSLLLGSGRPSSSLTPEDPILGALHCASSTRVRLCLARYRSCGQPPLSVVGEVGGAMEELTEEPVELVARVCAVDIGKAGLVVCVRVPHETRPGRRVQEVREYAAVTPALLALADWLRCQQVELVAMEATSDYWKPVFYLLEAEGFTCWLLNAKHVKNVPGRPKTDKLDAVWLAQGGRAWDVPAQSGAPQADPPASGRDPLPAQPGPRADPGEAAVGEDPRRRAAQAGLGHQ